VRLSIIFIFCLATYFFELITFNLLDFYIELLLFYFVLVEIGELPAEYIKFY